MKWSGTILILIILVLGAIFSLRIIFGGPEDSWVCVNGEWIKHGSPKVGMPLTNCDF